MTSEQSAASPGAPRRGWRLLGSVVAWALLAVAAYFVWPASLGGSTSFVFVSGESMTPGYQPGDLLIAREGEPVIGDVIVYAPEGFGGAQIVHRIIGGDAESGWVVQGDANSFIDPFEPKGDEVRGVVVAHIPGVGLYMQVLLSPYLWVSVLALATAVFVWPARAEDSEGEPDAEPAIDREPATVWLPEPELVNAP